MLERDTVESLLAEITDPLTGLNLVESKSVRGVGVDDDRVSVDIQMAYPVATVAQGLIDSISAHLTVSPAISAAVVNVSGKIQTHAVQKDLVPHKRIKNIIAIASGKGGVGKSTTAVNMALALKAEGAAVGLLDADIYGPSQPRMMGMSGKPESADGKTIEPKERFGVPTMSIGYIVDEDSAMIWRGPMVTQALQQMLTETNWPPLDYLIVDLPPGTGDIQLTLAQKIPVTGALIVTTPQDIALLDARRALAMFNKVEIAVLGVVENMSTHICSSCGHEEHIFGSGGALKMADDFAVELLGDLPLDIRIRQETDQGKPTVVAAPDSDIARRYQDIARRLAARISQRPRNFKGAFAPIKINQGPSS